MMPQSQSADYNSTLNASGLAQPNPFSAVSNQLSGGHFPVLTPSVPSQSFMAAAALQLNQTSPAYVTASQIPGMYIYPTSGYLQTPNLMLGTTHGMIQGHVDVNAVGHAGLHSHKLSGYEPSTHFGSVPTRKTKNSIMSKTNLYINGLNECDTDDTVRALVEGIIEPKSCKAMMSHGKCRGSGFIDCASEEDAEVVIQILKNKLMPDGSRLAVKFAYENEKDDLNVYVRNLPRKSSFTTANLEELFSEFGQVVSVKLLQSDNQYTGTGFVRYSRADEAQGAVEMMNGRKYVIGDDDKPVICKLADKGGRKSGVHADGSISAVTGGAPGTSQVTHSMDAHAQQHQHQHHQHLSYNGGVIIDGVGNTTGTVTDGKYPHHHHQHHHSVMNGATASMLAPGYVSPSNGGGNGGGAVTAGTGALTWIPPPNAAAVAAAVAANAQRQHHQQQMVQQQQQSVMTTSTTNSGSSSNNNEQMLAQEIHNLMMAATSGVTQSNSHQPQQQLDDGSGLNHHHPSSVTAHHQMYWSPSQAGAITHPIAAAAAQSHHQHHVPPHQLHHRTPPHPFHAQQQQQYLLAALATASGAAAHTLHPAAAAAAATAAVAPGSLTLAATAGMHGELPVGAPVCCLPNIYHLPPGPPPPSIVTASAPPPLPLPPGPTSAAVRSISLSSTIAGSTMPAQTASTTVATVHDETRVSTKIRNNSRVSNVAASTSDTNKACPRSTDVGNSSSKSINNCSSSSSSSNGSNNSIKNCTITAATTNSISNNTTSNNKDNNNNPSTNNNNTDTTAVNNGNNSSTVTTSPSFDNNSTRVTAESMTSTTNNNVEE